MKQIFDSNFISQDLLLQIFDVELLTECDIITLEFERKVKRINTRLNYTQHKYNVFNEEPEGYSKLIMFLCHTMPNNPNFETELERYTVFFDLDPNRIIDLLLTIAGEHFSYIDEYYNILRQYNSLYIVSTLGFKLQDIADVRITNSLLKVTAYLLRRGVFSLEQILPHLRPSIEDMKITYGKTVNK